MKISQLILIPVLALILAGCNSTEYRVKKQPERFAALTPGEQSAVQNKTLDIGHSAEVVYFIMGDPNRKQRQIKDGVNKEVWVYTRIFTEMEGTHLAGYERRIYYDSKYKVYRAYYVPRYVHEYSEHQEVVAEIEFEDGVVSAITEVES
ncbi:MAG: hypothetical protein O3C43_16085 [Verrucomicrobia bacterium]|nr:hypothetical protein [Verrucomicrobiota bacterium]MDA1068010.1 hypothetical protein [Verrucomicrobiota bacterium]